MRGNLPVREPQQLKRWEQENLYAELLKSRQGKPAFVLHDGPPYANGDIHMGHALNKVLKDIVVRYRSARGKATPYVPGWDCHGLPIEYQLMKDLGTTKHQVDRLEFRKKARAFALQFVETQRQQFKRLGCVGDWAHPYLTVESSYVAGALRALSALVRKGFVYRARRPVNWCWTCETALAEAEVEYEEHTSPSVYVKFELTPESVKKLNLPGDRDITRVYLIIWTTTPWTLMGNVAVAVHPQMRYAVRAAGMKRDGKRRGEAWIALAQPPPGWAAVLRRETRDSGEDVVLEIEGRQLENLEYEHPLGLRGGRVVLADYVSTEEGTGLVHTAPGFGAEDYQTGRKYGLEIVAPVDARGRFEGLPEAWAQLNGQQVQKANPQIVRRLKESGHLIQESELTHSYPHCWRCRKPIIFRATDQWFLRVDHEGLRERLLKAVREEVSWIPQAGRERMAGMLAGRPDWCLSRQRLWGIPIPAVICLKCGEVRLDPEVIERFARQVEREPEGSDRWFSEPVSRWLAPGTRCVCGGQTFEAGRDILDVWFDSGVSHQSVLGRREGLTFPADLYLEGSDQHRGWFQVSLITAVALAGRPSYRQVLTHGFVVDGEGRKMSKSLGNVIAPQQVVARHGADVLRFWVASSDYREDVRLSEEILAQVAESYRKIRNTVRFCLANVGDFDPERDRRDPKELASWDRWVLHRLRRLIEEVTGAYDVHAFHRVCRAVHGFCTLTLSNLYLDVVKDRLYTAHPRDPARLETQSALYETAEALIRMTAPILPMTAEEAWTALHGEGARSVHLAPWPDPARLPFHPEMEKDWERLLAVRDQAMKALEQARGRDEIGEPLEAELEIAAGEGSFDFLKTQERELAAACIVSGLKVRKAAAGERGITVRVRRAPGRKCRRCWMRLASVGRDPEHSQLCDRCVKVVRKLTAA